MANWTATLRALTVGDGTDYPILQPGITGLGLPAVRTADQPRGHLSGDVGGDDVYDKRTLTIPVGIDATTAELAFDLLEDLKVAWAYSQVDLDLTLALAGVTRVYSGRPRGCEADLASLGQGWVNVLLTFDCLNPFAEGDPVDVQPGGS